MGLADSAGVRAVASSLRTCAVIPARAGSKRLPNKNLLELAGRPLYWWSVDAAVRSGLFDAIIVSTDIEAILEQPLPDGVIAHRRLAKLATDTARSVDVVRDALRVVRTPDVVVLLQPTSPLRTPEDITDTVDALLGSGCDAAVTVAEGAGTAATTRWRRHDGTLSAVADRSATEVHLTGSVYSNLVEPLLASGEFVPEGAYGLLRPIDRSVDIDVAEDFERARRMLEHR